MPLKAIIDDLVADMGVSVNNDSERALLVTRINQCAKEVYDSTDLIGSLREQVFDMSFVDAPQQVSFPFYVGSIRGLRYYDSRLKIRAHDMMPRYSYGKGQEVWSLQFREIGKYPLARDIANESILNVSIPLEENSAFNVIISGATNNSYKSTEIVTLAPGEISKFTTANFKAPIDSIQKSVITSYNVTIKDIDDNILAVIPNTELFSSYTVVQILDNNPTANQMVIECLYKQRFINFSNDFDEFPCGPKYDKVIYWKYVEHEAGRNKDIPLASAAVTKANAIIKQINADAEGGLEKPMLVAPCQYFNLSDYSLGRFTRRSYPRYVR